MPLIIFVCAADTLAISPTNIPPFKFHLREPNVTCIIINRYYTSNGIIWHMTYHLLYKPVEIMTLL